MKVFVTGAAGYIGGSVAQRLVAAGYEVTGLTRSQDKAPLLKEQGVDAVVGSLDDRDLLTQAALAADAVVHAADADHPASLFTLVAALECSGKTLIHTTGSSIVADHADGEHAAQRPVSDDSWFEPVPYRRPRVDMIRFVRQAAIDKGMRSMVICPGMVYGAGLGLQPDSDQLPKLIALSKQAGAGLYFGKGLNRYSNVHINDLADLYLLALERAPGGSFFFAENGHNSFKEIAELMSEHLGFDGRAVSVPMEQVIQQYGEFGRLGVGSNSLVVSANARRLGWDPRSPSLAEFLSVHKG